MSLCSLTSVSHGGMYVGVIPPSFSWVFFVTSRFLFPPPTVSYSQTEATPAHMQTCLHLMSATAALTNLATCLFSPVCAVRASGDAPDWAQTGVVSVVRLHRAEDWQGPLLSYPSLQKSSFYTASLKSCLCWLVGNHQQFDEKFNRSHGWKGPLMTAKKLWHLLQLPPESASV